MQKEASLGQLLPLPHGKKAQRDIKIMHELSLNSGQAGPCLRWSSKHIEKKRAKHCNYKDQDSKHPMLAISHIF